MHIQCSQLGGVSSDDVPYAVFTIPSKVSSSETLELPYLMTEQCIFSGWGCGGKKTFFGYRGCVEGSLKRARQGAWSAYVFGGGAVYVQWSMIIVIFPKSSIIS